MERLGWLTAADLQRTPSLICQRESEASAIASPSHSPVQVEYVERPSPKSSSMPLTT